MRSQKFRAIFKNFKIKSYNVKTANQNFKEKSILETKSQIIEKTVNFLR